MFIRRKDYDRNLKKRKEYIRRSDIPAATGKTGSDGWAIHKSKGR